MSAPLPDPSRSGTPSTDNDIAIPGPVFKRVWLSMMAVILVVLAVVIGFQVFG